MTPKVLPQKTLRRIYKSPPISEAICVFEFEYKHPWDWTVPGLFYEKISSEFPDKQEQHTASINEKEQKVIRQRDRMQFFSRGKQFAVQVREEALAINHLPPYTDWETYRKLVHRNLQIYYTLVDIKAIKRAGIRYINQIVVPKSEVDLEKYFRIGIDLPSAIPSTVHGYLMRTEIPFEKIGALLSLTLASANSRNPGTSTFVLDIDFTSREDAHFDVERSLDWIEAAHKQVDIVFESCLTTATKKMFGGLR